MSEGEKSEDETSVSQWTSHLQKKTCDHQFLKNCEIKMWRKNWHACAISVHPVAK